KSLQALGDSVRFRDALADAPGITGFLDTSRRELGLDFLYIVVRNEGVVVAARTEPSPQRRGGWPIIAKALTQSAATAIDIFTERDLREIAGELALRSHFELVPTPNAVATDRIVETRGMVVHSAAPIVLPDGRPGALVGGILLNQNLGFVDTIN